MTDTGWQIRKTYTLNRESFDEKIDVGAVYLAFAQESGEYAAPKAKETVSVRRPAPPRVNRGGSWDDDARYCRTSNRSDNSPCSRYNSLGLRLARTQ